MVCFTNAKVSFRKSLKGIRKRDSTPEIIRRALTLDEIKAILSASPRYLQILSKTALCSGLRKGELKALTIKHLDIEASTLRVDADVDKARKERFQVIPKWLAEELAEYAKTGEPEDLYMKHSRCKNKDSSKHPTGALLFVPDGAERALKRVARKAGVEIMNDKGKIDFHALRTAYINLLLDTGTDAKTVMEMSRHSSANMTMLVYGRAKSGRMVGAVEKLGQIVSFKSLNHSSATPKNGDNKSPFVSKGCVDKTNGSNPLGPTIF